MKILVLEDSFTVASVVEIKLSKAGHQVTVADTAEEALTAIKTSRPDLLILDLAVPNVNTDHVVAKLKLLSPDTRIIVYSSQRSDQIIAATAKYGAIAGLEKEPTLRELMSTIEAYQQDRQEFVDKSETENRTRILLVDDDIDQHELFMKIFGTRRDIELKCTDSSMIASMAAAFQADLILLDVELGSVRKGDQIAKFLSEKSIVPNARIVLYSSAEEEVLQQKCASAGATGYIKKGQSSASLIRSIESYIQ